MDEPIPTEPTLTDLVLTEVSDEAMLLACVAVIREAFGTVADEYGFTEESAPTNAAFLTVDRLREVQRRGDHVLALTAGTRIVGSVSLRPASDPAVAYLEHLAVAPACRHRGYGTVLVERSCALAAADGATTVSVGIIDANETLKGWYQRLGFAVTGTRVFQHLPFDVCYLQRPL